MHSIWLVMTFLESWLTLGNPGCSRANPLAIPFNFDPIAVVDKLVVLNRYILRSIHDDRNLVSREHIAKNCICAARLRCVATAEQPDSRLRARRDAVTDE